MCVIEQKTYVHSNGDRRTVETSRRCRNATGTRLCSRVERRTIESRPSGPSASEGIIVTQGRDGREKVYRDLSRRNSRRSTVRRSNPTNDQMPPRTPTGASPTAPGARIPRAPTPPPLSAQSELPSYPPSLPPLRSAMFRADGTALYDSPPSLGMPRAIENERRPSTPHGRRSSFSRTTAEVDDVDPAPGRRRPSISVTTSFRRSANDIINGSPPTSSPGLSHLPKLRDIRHDSANEIPQRVPQYDDDEYLTRPSARDAARNRRSDSEAVRRRRDDLDAENRRQAQLEQDRYRARDRAREDSAARQALRAVAAREEASRERHRRATAAALEAAATPTARAARIEAENRQLDLEAARAAARRSQSEEQPPRRLAADRLSPASPGPSRLPRPSQRYNSSSPLSPRGAVARSNIARPTLHHYTPPISPSSNSRRPSDSIRDRGREVIAREQARAAAATAEFQDVLGEPDDLYADDLRFGSLRLEERRPEPMDGFYDTEKVVDEYHYVSDGLARRESRRSRREEGRERRMAEFWR